MVFGPKWDKYNLTPWVYDVKRNTWSNKLTPDGKTLPPLPKVTIIGRSVLIENKVYLFTGGQVLILDLSTLEEWKDVKLDETFKSYPIVVPFSPTEVAIFGRKVGFTNHNKICIFDSKIELSRRLKPQTDVSEVDTLHSAVVVSGQLAFAQQLTGNKNIV